LFFGRQVKVLVARCTANELPGVSAAHCLQEPLVGQRKRRERKKKAGRDRYCAVTSTQLTALFYGAEREGVACLHINEARRPASNKSTAAAGERQGEMGRVTKRQ
jgi:hypothetical protein